MYPARSGPPIAATQKEVPKKPYIVPIALSPKNFPRSVGKMGTSPL